MKKKIFNALKVLIFLGIGIFFIWLFLKDLSPEDRREIMESVKGANYFWLVLSIILGLVSHWIRAVRWKSLMKPMGFNPSIRNTFLAVMVGYFANLALPRLGEVSRCAMLRQYEKIPLTNAFGTVVIERAVDMLIFVLLFFLNLAIQFNKIEHYVTEKIYNPLSEKFVIIGSGYFTWILIGGFIFIVVFLYFIRKKITHFTLVKKITDLLKGLWDGLISIRKLEKPGVFILQSLAIWVFYFLMSYVCFFSLADTNSLGLEAGLSVLMFGSIGIMVVQGGIGIYPAIVAETLGIYSISATTGYALGWLLWSAQTAMIVLAGIVSLILLPLLNPNAKKPQNDNERNHSE